MPIFNDSENINRGLVEPGDYIWRIVDWETGTCTRGKLSGSIQHTAEILFEGPGVQMTERFTEHEKTMFRIDTMLKSAGVKLTKGEDFDFVKTEAEARGVRWVDPIGLRGWCRVAVEDKMESYLDGTVTKYRVKHDAEGKPMKQNKIVLFYTDKEKLPRATDSEPATENEPF